MHHQRLAVASPPASRQCDPPAPRQIGAGDGPVAGQHIVEATADHDLAAVLTGSRTDVDDVVCRTHGVLIVFDDDQRVAQVAQALQGLDQAVIVALVQADGRLIQHVQHTGQARPDLGGQPDALRLTARQ